MTPGDGPVAGQEWGGFKQGRRGLVQRPTPRESAVLAARRAAGAILSSLAV